MTDLDFLWPHTDLSHTHTHRWHTPRNLSVVNCGINRCSQNYGQMNSGSTSVSVFYWFYTSAAASVDCRTSNLLFKHQPGRTTLTVRIHNALTSGRVISRLPFFSVVRFVSSGFRMLPIITTGHHGGIISRRLAFLPTISINFYGRFLSISTVSQEDATVAHFSVGAQLSIFSLISSGGSTLSCRPQINTSELFNHG